MVTHVQEPPLLGHMVPVHVHIHCHHTDLCSLLNEGRHTSKDRQNLGAAAVTLNFLLSLRLGLQVTSYSDDSNAPLLEKRKKEFLNQYYNSVLWGLIKSSNYHTVQAH